MDDLCEKNIVIKTVYRGEKKTQGCSGIEEIQNTITIDGTLFYDCTSEYINIEHANSHILYLYDLLNTPGKDKSKRRTYIRRNRRNSINFIWKRWFKGFYFRQKFFKINF